MYFANATVGTPPQSVRLHIDTGSSDLWLNTPKSDLCLTGEDICETAGVYSANSSSTYSYVSSDFNISYVDGSGAAGDYATDTVAIGSASLKGLQFGIGYESSSSEGILGIGYAVNEVQVARFGKAPYENLPAKLAANSMIQSNAYSLWLNDLDTNTGSILFGGVDKAKYIGSLETLPIQRRGESFAEFLISLTGVGLDGNPIAQNLAQAVLLDSGSSLTYLPDAITEAIYQKLNAQYSAEDGVAFVPCSLANSDSTLDFTFSSPTIKVPMNELVITIPSTTGRQLTFTDGTPACLFGLSPAGSMPSVFGDTFLRSAYVVYDLENNEISLAQTNFNSTGTNVVEIASGTSGVPDATLVADSVAATVGAATAARTSTAGIGELSRVSKADHVLPCFLSVVAGTGFIMLYLVT